MNSNALFAMTSVGLLATACNPLPPGLYGEPQLSAAVPDMSPMPPDLAERPYPEGPYGAKVGDVMFPIDLAGYRLSLTQTDSTKVEWEEHLTLASVRSQSNAKCIMLGIDAFW